ncbi:MAG: isoprenylcysteine carboxylmethyltransferase family protein [Spirochaetes bacterium]|nr:isoprenylcysteine carboxylmethyltransferase family protein [Spirochaetota bacterium]
MSRKQPHKEKQRHRPDLTGEHRLSDAGQAILAFLFAASWIPDTFFLNYTTFLNRYGPPAVRITLGAVILGLSGFLAAKGVSIVFGEKREPPGVIKEGVFSVVRHPVYLSEILLYLGLLFFSTSLIAAVIWVIAIGFLYYMSRYEERLLLTRFGEEYEKYMREVGMWFPRLRKR